MEKLIHGMSTGCNERALRRTSRCMVSPGSENVFLKRSKLANTLDISHLVEDALAALRRPPHNPNTCLVSLNALKHGRLVIPPSVNQSAEARY